MQQIILQLIDLYPHLLVIKSELLQLIVVRFNVFLLFGYRSLVPFSLLFKLDACLAELSSQILHVFCSHWESTCYRSLSLRLRYRIQLKPLLLNLFVDIWFVLFKSILFSVNEVPILIQLPPYISSLFAHVSYTVCIICRRLFLDRFEVHQLLLQLFVLLDAWVVEVVLRKEFSRCLPIDSVCIHQTIHVWINCMIEHRSTNTKATALSVHNWSSLTLTYLFTHFSDQRFHCCFGYLLFFNWLNVCYFYHAQRKRIVRLFILSFNFFFYTAIRLIIHVVFLKVC